MVRPIGIVVAIYVDGSFITDKTMPSDIDLVLELPPFNKLIVGALMRPEFDFVEIKHRLKLDVWPWYPGAPRNDDWVNFFQEISPKDLVRLQLKPAERKGILRIEL